MTINSAKLDQTFCLNTGLQDNESLAVVIGKLEKEQTKTK